MGKSYDVPWEQRRTAAVSRLSEETQRHDCAGQVPTPTGIERMESFEDKSIFFTVYCNSGYWQNKIQEADRGKTYLQASVSYCSLSGRRLD